jgi:hypothetical protein
MRCLLACDSDEEAAVLILMKVMGARDSAAAAAAAARERAGPGPAVAAVMATAEQDEACELARALELSLQ